MALDFDGVANIARNANGLAALDGGDWSIAAWVNVDTAGLGSNGTILRVENTSTLRAEMRFDSTVTRGLSVGDNGATDGQVITSSTVPVTTWTLLVGTFDFLAGQPRAYFGDLSTPMAEQAYGTNTQMVTQVTGSNRLSIGNNDAVTRTFDGRISRVGIWTKVLSLTEMETLRAGTVPRDRCARFWPCGDDGTASTREIVGAFNLTVTGAADASGPSLPFAFEPEPQTFDYAPMKTS